MLIIPAIDLFNGQVVRLLKGSTRHLTVYSDDPAGMAAQYEEDGAKLLHVVDLNGAKEGSPGNLASLKKILKAVSIPVQFGGGVRTHEAIRKLFDMGVSRVIVGTRAYEDKNFIKKIPSRLLKNIVAAADMKGEMLSIKGWDTTACITAHDFIESMQEQGLTTFLVTQVLRDGTLKGPDFNGMKKLLASFHCKFILSGGVATLNDIRKANKLPLYGAVVGKALYEKKFTLKQALHLARKT